MKNITTIITALLMCFSSFSQSKQGLWWGVEMSKGTTFVDTGKRYDIHSGGARTMTALQAVLGYYVTPNLSLGASLASNIYTRNDLSTIPLSLDIRYHPISGNTRLVLSGNVGYPLVTNESNRSGRCVADIATGYNLTKISNFDLFVSIGYNWNMYHMNNQAGLDLAWANISSDMHKHSLFLKISIIH